MAAGDGSSSAGHAVPLILLAVIATGLLIAVTLIAIALGNSDSGDPIGPAKAAQTVTASAAPAEEERVLLRLQIEGGGTGTVRIEPLGSSCAETCERELDTGTRVELTAEADDGSRFEGWADACSGGGSCTIVMDGERALTATFEGSGALNECADGDDNDGDGLVDERDPGCRRDNTEAPDNSPVPDADCADGRDNDGDGLIDSAQDPGCDGGGTEIDGDTDKQPGGVATAPAPPPPPATTTGAQTIPGVSECRDGIDNDGDGRIDRPDDPGCDADATEAGDR